MTTQGAWFAVDTDTDPGQILTAALGLPAGARPRIQPPIRTPQADQVQ